VVFDDRFMPCVFRHIAACSYAAAKRTSARLRQFGWPMRSLVITTVHRTILEGIAYARASALASRGPVDGGTSTAAPATFRRAVGQRSTGEASDRFHEANPAAKLRFDRVRPGLRLLASLTGRSGLASSTSVGEGHD
jgi:hypothetical protein